VQLFCDDGSRKPGPRLGFALAAGSAEAFAILAVNSAWNSEEAVQALVDADAAAQHAIGKLVMAIGAEAKPEWLSRESTASEWRTTGTATLKQIVKGGVRSVGEQTVGPTTVNRPTTVNAKQFEFARRRDRGPAGGY